MNARSITQHKWQTHIQGKGIKMLVDGIRYARQCTACGAGMNKGYIIEGGCEYYCSDLCLHKHISPDEFEELHDDGDGDSYWTEWDDESEWDDETEGDNQ